MVVHSTLFLEKIFYIGVRGIEGVYVWHYFNNFSGHCNRLSSPFTSEFDKIKPL